MRYAAPGIQQRRRKYYAVCEIPPPLRKKLKRSRFIESLGTDSLAVARRRAPPIIAQWHREIATARGEPDDDAAAFFRRRLAKSKTDEQREVILEQIVDASYEIGMVSVDRIGTNPLSAPEASDFYDRATGVPFIDYLDQWAAQAGLSPKTTAMHRSVISQFAKVCPSISDVTHEAVQKWVSGLKVAPATIRRNLSGLKGYWKFMQRADIAAAPKDLRPFSEIDLPKHRVNLSDKRQPFTSADVVRLLKAAKGDSVLADAIKIAAYSAMRIEEIFVLKATDVGDDYLMVRGGKSDAAQRQIPIHMKLAPTIKRLRKASRGGHLLPGSKGQYDLSGAVSKRFGKLKTKLGFGPQHVFHSIRKTVATMLENAGVSENIAADILGHKKQSMTYGVYSGGASLELKRDALAKLRY